MLHKIKGTDPFWGPLFLTNFGHNYLFLFLGEKVSSGIWETCPKILGGYVYQNPPPQMGANNKNLIYIYNCMYPIIIIIISKNIS